MTLGWLPYDRQLTHIYYFLLRYLGEFVTVAAIIAVVPASGWQNGSVERLIGSIRRECLDHVVVLGEAHLRRILKAYVSYYNAVRTHLSLNKDAPIHRPIVGSEESFQCPSSVACTITTVGRSFR